MQTEIEAKWPDIDAPIMRQYLEQLGATQEHPEILMRRKVFDYPDNRLDAIGGWVRVRDEGKQITMSYKQLNDRTLYGTKEVNLVIDNFDNACDFLISVGFISKAYQETKREKWRFGDTEVTIDTWPWIPSFIELEGPTEETVRMTAQLLGLDWERAMHGSVETVYQMHYNFTEKEIDHWESITFIPAPAWLAAKKK